MSTMLLVRLNPYRRKLVDVRQQLPPEWAALAGKKGIAPSFRAIAMRAELAVTTVTRMITEGRTTPESVSKVATALGVDEEVVMELANLPVPDLGLWDPPEEAHQLNGAERAVLDDLIRVMAKRGETSADRQSKAEKKVTDLASRREDWRAAYEAGQLAADEQDEEPEGIRRRREQDEAAERQD